ncbi:DegT/DnrJ/EryC1/StrS family aminotransferase [Acidisoma cellulosilytica]|uniref:DegT/DnrJ/EryC1/StrS family aminotransferase n=1 Tax=Acidisoma cellulosilyticum TaxID=2802395 RepID=A0A964E6U4_9PROT|nr:DegT/DnrJ/EryC1/StrS family aminotransferase [Acidisoma cellulosilyticum]MCB8883368.1 DegT/DnrJ/EryC1/StrS family aminotransferase [Acidisoma cellulosilyticum]
MVAVEPIPIYVAQLPRAEVLLPYLRQIDANAQYTNRGPLVALLEARMAGALGLPVGSVTLAANGTTALQAAILAAAGRARPGRMQALLPGYTFVATAHAAEACGYQVKFVDVSAATWAMDPVAMLDRPDLDRVGVVIPVAPYGAAFDYAGWVQFQNRTQIPVVIDAAASFEAIARQPCCITAEVPVTLSLHATKAFTTAEGGAILWRDGAGMQRAVAALGFGLTGEEHRWVNGPGLNGRLSEYHAAIGLAGLDAADRTAAERTRLHDAYKAAAVRAGLDAACLVSWPEIGSNYALVEASSLEAAERLIASFAAAGVTVRRWYGLGLHREPFFAADCDGSLPNTESLGDRIIGLPVYPGMGASQIDRVLQVLAADAASAGPSPRSRMSRFG